MYASESAPERASPSEGLNLEPHSMLSIAVKISSHNTERNVKVNCGQIIVLYYIVFFKVVINEFQRLKTEVYTRYF